MAEAPCRVEHDRQIERPQVAGSTKGDLLGRIDRQTVTHGMRWPSEPRADQPRSARTRLVSLNRGEHRCLLGKARQLPAQKPCAGDVGEHRSRG